MLKKVILACGLVAALNVVASENELPASFVQLSAAPELQSRVESLEDGERGALIEVCGRLDKLRGIVLQEMGTIVTECAEGIETLKKVTGAEGFDLMFQLVPRFAQPADDASVEDADRAEYEEDVE